MNNGGRIERGIYQNIPDEFLRLGVEGLIPSSHRNLFCCEKIQHLHLQRPETPTPVLPIFVRLLGTFHTAHSPRFTTVQRYLHTCHLSPTSCINDNNLQVYPKFTSKAKSHQNLFFRLFFLNITFHNDFY